MILFRPLIRYADFKGRASRSEYWLFAVLQGFWYALLIGLATMAMGQDAHPAEVSKSVVVVFGLMVLSMVALIVPNYAVLVRRLHDSGKGAIWLGLMVPSILSAVMAVGTIATAIGSVGLGASREAFLGTVMAGLGAAGLLGVLGYVGQLILFVLTLLPGTKGENAFGPDPRDPGQRYGDFGGGSALDEDRLDALFAEAKRANGMSDEPYKPIFDFGPGPSQPAPVQRASTWPEAEWNRPAAANGLTPAPVFGKRRS
ncbi:DUF805 domain-containing protein [Brevundimonas staleyi]|uniref:DUF805 domain-containing protein n=1 Tax=Brevundimonas staleyi TaxID=74326 RepID=A0ABW0FS82_9CAUL